MLPLLFAEIGHALVVGNMEEVPVLRLELYGASMQKCQNDLQQWISYLAERTEKLGFLGHKARRRIGGHISKRASSRIPTVASLFFHSWKYADDLGQGNHHCPQICRHAGPDGGIGQIARSWGVPKHVCCPHRTATETAKL